MTASIEENTGNVDDIRAANRENGDIDLLVDGGQDEEEEDQSAKAKTTESKRQCLSRNTNIALMGVTIGILFTIVVALVFKVVSINNKNQEKTSGGLSMYTSTVVSSPTDGKGGHVSVTYENVTTNTAAAANEGDETNEEEESSGKSKDEFVPEQEGKVKIPIALNDMIKKWTTVKQQNGRHLLNIPTDMLQRLNGRCAYFEDYELADNIDPVQCSASDRVLGYTPSDQTYELWSEATGVSEDALRNIRMSTEDEPEKLCAMPLPPESQPGARQYWQTCIQPRAGFFNTLHCKGMCTKTDIGPDEDPNDFCSTIAVLGFAMMDSGVCYPSHKHYAEEGYWQIAGRGWWRTWADRESNYVKDMDWITTKNVMGSKYPFHAQRQMLPHEMDTTSSIDGQGEPMQILTDMPMIMIYFWGMSNDLQNEYQQEPYIGDTDGFVQGGVGAGSCGNHRRIPSVDKEFEVSLNNC